MRTSEHYLSQSAWGGKCPSIFLLGSFANGYIWKFWWAQINKKITVNRGDFWQIFPIFLNISIRPKKKKCYVALTRPKFKNWVGRSGFFFFFFFFLRTVRELSFPIFFLKFLNGENSGGMQSKRIYKSCKCFFKPLNTNFSKFFAQIWHKKKKKKNDPVFSHFTVGRERATYTFFFFGLMMNWIQGFI